MRKYSWVAIAAIFAAALWAGVSSYAADNAVQYAGKWTGTWEGAGGAGRFDLTLESGSDGKLNGGVSVGSDTGDYTAKFSSFSLSDNKLTAKYEYPPEPMAEIVLAATFENGKATGTWVMQAKGAPDQVAASGTWTVKK
jgi:hypothetical protein